MRIEPGGAVTRTGLDTNQHWRVAGVRGLQSRGIFKTVAGDNPIIGVSRCDQHRRIMCLCINIMIWRIRKQCRKFLRIVGGTVVINPEAADRKFVKAQHVHYANCRDRGSE